MSLRQDNKLSSINKKIIEIKKKIQLSGKLSLGFLFNIYFSISLSGKLNYIKLYIKRFVQEFQRRIIVLIKQADDSSASLTVLLSFLSSLCLTEHYFASMLSSRMLTE